MIIVNPSNVQQMVKLEVGDRIPYDWAWYGNKIRLEYENYVCLLLLNKIQQVNL